MKLISINIISTAGMVVVAAAGGGDDKWWKGLTKEQQKAYIKQHPNSKYARNAKKLAEEKKSGAGPVEDTKTNSESEKKHVSVKSLHADRIAALPEEHRKFFENEGDKPGSEERKGIANHIRTNKHEIIKHIKGQFKEWGDGCGAIGKLASGKKISDHEKKAVKALLIDAAVIAGAVAITGGFAHGAALAVKHVGFDILKDIVLKATIRGTTKAMGASTGVTGLVGLQALANSSGDHISRRALRRHLEQSGWLDFLMPNKEELDDHHSKLQKTGRLVVRCTKPGSSLYAVVSDTGVLYLKGVSKEKALQYANRYNSKIKSPGGKSDMTGHHSPAYAAANSKTTKKASSQESKNEKILEILVEKMADFIEKGDIPAEAWEKALAELERAGKKSVSKK
jgi:hypothetical protein